MAGRPGSDDPVAAPDVGRADPGLRALARVAAVGAVTAVAAMVATMAATGSGRSGLAVLLLLGALTSATVGLVGTAMLLRDEVRDQHISRLRIVTTIGAFLVTTLLLAMVVGVAS